MGKVKSLSSNKEEILSWLEKNDAGFHPNAYNKDIGPNKYTISDDGVIDVVGYVKIDGLGLSEIPYRFGEIIGGFVCSDNFLTSLKNGPHKVTDFYSCTNNRLTNLEHSPDYVGGEFYAFNNPISSLRGAPKYVGGRISCFNSGLYKLSKFDLPKDFVGEVFIGNIYWHDRVHVELSEFFKDIPEIYIFSNITQKKDELTFNVNLRGLYESEYKVNIAFTAFCPLYGTNRYRLKYYLDNIFVNEVDVGSLSPMSVLTMIFTEEEIRSVKLNMLYI
jgi:hypothetical protein